jgi:hypothetical protein
MPTNIQLPIHTISLVGFVAAALIFVFYSGMAIYSLLRFGKSQMLGTLGSAIYTALAIILFIHALNALLNI